MRAFRYLRVAFQSIVAHKLRATLTMLGIIIGVAAVLTTIGIGSGAAADITDRIESSGTNILTVSAGGSGTSGTGTTLTLADAEVLNDPVLFPDIMAVAPQYSSSAMLSYAGTEGTYTVAGTTPSYAAATNKTLLFGDFLSEAQLAGNESVVVLGYTVAVDLFAGTDPVGQSLRIDNHLFEVIGVLGEVGGNARFGSADSQVFVPIEVAMGRLFSADRYRGSYTLSSITVQVDSSDNLSAAEVAIERTLRMRHELGADDDNDFMISNQADMLEMASDVSGTLTALLGSIGAVSLVVGGIGIMNIMLVSVTERTREIGLRKALGAHDSDILLQFLIEALVLTALGGLIGIAISYGSSLLLTDATFFPYKVVIEPWAILLALGVSTASGFVFGLYPAMRATQLDPIEALRFE